MIPQKQLSADIFEDCKNIYESDKPQFLTLLENHIDLDEIIPVSFYHHYYASTGRKRKYPFDCYAYKFGILTNGLGIVRSIDFYNKDYLHSHPDIVVEKKAKSPDEDKSLADSKALLPTLQDFKSGILTLIPAFFLKMQPLILSKSTNPYLYT